MSSHLVPCVLCALALSFVFACGCSRDEGKPPAPPAAVTNRSPATKVVADPPEVYMKDPVFQKAVKQAAAERNKAAARRQVFVQEMNKLLEAKRKELGDEAKARAAVEKTREWKRLEKQLEFADAEVASAQSQLQKIVHDRIAPKRVPVESK